MPRSPEIRPALAVALALVSCAALGCGEEVLVGRWVLRSSATDAGLADAGAAQNPQSFHAERARERARSHDESKNGHDPSRPGDKRH